MKNVTDFYTKNYKILEGWGERIAGGQEFKLSWATYQDPFLLKEKELQNIAEKN